MKIAIISDLHLGYGDEERTKEAFEAAEQAFELAIENKVEFILLPGDIFDASVPKQEIWHQAFRLLNLAKKQETRKMSITTISKKGGVDRLDFQGIPVIAIHGTHEFRGKDYKNALQVLEEAKALIYSHAEVLLIEKDYGVEEERVAVHCLGGVPEKVALDVLNEWHPKPMDKAFNILVFHQSLKEFLPTPDPMAASISLSDLPPGFQLYVDGHLHWHDELKIEQGKFLLPGSLIFTQMKKLEAEREKGIYLFDTQENEAKFLPLPVQRQLFYHKLEFKQATPEGIRQKIEELLQADLLDTKPLKPLIRIKIQGSLAPGFSPSDIDFSSILKDYEGRAILSLTKNFAKQSFKKKIDELRQMQQARKSLAEVGLNLLEKNLAQTSFDDAFEVKEVFELLAQGEGDKALAKLKEKTYHKPKEKSAEKKAGQATLFS